MGGCKFCEKPTNHRQIGWNRKYWVCKECDQYRCSDCGCFLHNRESINNVCLECIKDRSGGDTNEV